MWSKIHVPHYHPILIHSIKKGHETKVENFFTWSFFCRLSMLALVEISQNVTIPFMTTCDL
jgi:hypothetical protein